MKCYFHPQEEAVASCTQCGKALCHECASKYTPCLCDDCYQRLRQEERDNLKAARRDMLTTLAVSILLSGLVAFITFGLSEAKTWGWILTTVAFFAPYGWRYANLLGLTWFFNLNVAGCFWMMVIYSFRAVVATLIGVFCFIAAMIKYIHLFVAEKTSKIEDLEMKR